MRATVHGSPTSRAAFSVLEVLRLSSFPRIDGSMSPRNLAP